MDVFIETVGCPKNQEDSERMAGYLCAAGHRIAESAEDADAIVVNTCGFIEAAKRESIDTIFSYAPLREDGKRLIVTGCLAQRYADELAQELPEADALLGVNDYARLPQVLAGLDGARTDDACRRRGDRPRSPDASPAPTAAGALGSMGEDAPAAPAPRVALAPRAVSYLKIADGCDNRCTYCVIPSIRGPYRSVPIETLLDEARALLAEGCRELVLIAQDVTGYGTDIYGAPRLAELVRALCRVGEGECGCDGGQGGGAVSCGPDCDDGQCGGAVSLRPDCDNWQGGIVSCGSDCGSGQGGFEWIRLLYCYEERVTDELIRVMAEEPKVCKYIDLPLQHVSAGVLKRMGRRSTPESIRSTIWRLRDAMPGIVVRTTFITGFPGETDEDFAELCGFVREQRLGRVGVFAYSREEGTPAYDMPGQVPPDIAEARRDELMRIQLGISLEENERLVGTVQMVRVESVEGTGTDAVGGVESVEGAGADADGSGESGDGDAAAGGERGADGAGSAGLVFYGRTRGDAPEIDNGVVFTAGAGGAGRTAGTIGAQHAINETPGRLTAGAGGASGIIGNVVPVRITDAMDYDLVGEMEE